MSITTQSFAMRHQAEQARVKQVNPHHFYVWQMDNGRWAVSLLTRFRDRYYGSEY